MLFSRSLARHLLANVTCANCLGGPDAKMRTRIRVLLRAIAPVAREGMFCVMATVVRVTPAQGAIDVLKMYLPAARRQLPTFRG